MYIENEIETWVKEMGDIGWQAKNEGKKNSPSVLRVNEKFVGAETYFKVYWLWPWSLLLFIRIWFQIKSR